MADSTGLSVYVEADPIEIEAGSLKYGNYVPRYDPTPTIKAGQRSTIASEKLDDNMQEVSFNLVQDELDKLRTYILSKGSQGLNVSLTNGVVRIDYRAMFLDSSSDLMVEDNGKPVMAVTLKGTQVV